MVDIPKLGDDELNNDDKKGLDDINTKFKVGDYIVIDKHADNDNYPEPDKNELDSYYIDDIVYSFKQKNKIYVLQNLDLKERNEYYVKNMAVPYIDDFGKKSCPVCGDDYITCIFAYDFGAQNFDDCVCRFDRKAIVHNKKD